MTFARCVRGIVHYYNNTVELALFSFIFFVCVTNGEPTIGILWETFQKYIREKSSSYNERSDYHVTRKDGTYYGNSLLCEFN